MQKPQLMAAASAKKRGKNEKEETIYIKNRSIWELESFGSFLHVLLYSEDIKKKSVQILNRY